MQTPLLFIILAVVAQIGSCAPYGKNASEWQGRRIYQLLTDRFGGQHVGRCNPPEEVYCGGTFQGIIDHLDYIQGMGFNAIWISPVVENTKNGYHGYWAKDLFAVNPYFGTKSELQALIAACHARDIWVMADIVLNHVGPVWTNISQITPFNDTSYYHQPCLMKNTTCNSEELLDCWLYDLPDLDQDQPYVMDQLVESLKWLMGTFPFDGIRADTVMYVKQKYWARVQETLGTYIVGEIWSGFECNKIYTDYGVDATLNYQLFWSARSVFQNSSNSMKALGDTWRQQLTLKQPNWEGNFLDNHDTTRFLHDQPNVGQYMSALAHMYFTNGVPIVYYGTEQYFSGTIQGTECREPLWPTQYNTSTDMYGFLARLNGAYDRFQPQRHQVVEILSDDAMYCYVRGMVLVCTTNSLAMDQTRTLTGLPFANKRVMNWLTAVDVGAGASSMTVTIKAGKSPLILVGKDETDAPSRSKPHKKTSPYVYVIVTAGVLTVICIAVLAFLHCQGRHQRRKAEIHADYHIYHHSVQ